MVVHQDERSTDAFIQMAVFSHPSKGSSEEALEYEADYDEVPPLGVLCITYLLRSPSLMCSYKGDTILITMNNRCR